MVQIKCSRVLRRSGVDYEKKKVLVVASDAAVAIVLLCTVTRRRHPLPRPLAALSLNREGAVQSCGEDYAYPL